MRGGIVCRHRVLSRNGWLGIHKDRKSFACTPFISVQQSPKLQLLFLSFIRRHYFEFILFSSSRGTFPTLVNGLRNPMLELRELKSVGASVREIQASSADFATS